MGWLADIRGTIVALDTAPLIYFMEENPKYLRPVKSFFKLMDEGEIEVVTSTLTLTEVLVQPMRKGNKELADQYRDVLLGAKNLRTVPLMPNIAEEAASLRATHNIKTPDTRRHSHCHCHQ